MANTYESFEDLVRGESIESLPRNGNRQLGSDGKAFAYFRYEGQKWRLNADSKVERIMQAYECLKPDRDPFIMTPTRTNKGTCLDLKEGMGPKGFYAYEVASKKESGSG